MNDWEPDFIIAGAQKCGTSWLHHTLHSLPNVAVAYEEIHLAEVNDFVAHPDFFRHIGNQIYQPNAEDNLWARTARDLRRENPHNMVGWDSTALFHTHLSIQRLADEYSKAKIIILLRNPVNRSYSHYWHRVRTGRCSRTFEGELLRGDKQIVLRSIYRDQAIKFKQAFGERVLFVLYEELFSDPLREFAQILGHIGAGDIEFEGIVQDSLSKKVNSNLIPNFLPGWLLASRILTGFELGHYAKHVSGKPTFSSLIGAYSYKLKLAAMVLAGCGYSRTRRPPPMNPSTRKLLACYLHDANYGLSDIIDKDVDAAWFVTKSR